MANKNTIHALFEEYVEEFPNHIAIIDGRKSLTYNELNKKANQLARYLQKFKIKPDTPIALCLDRSFDFVITLIAILKAGAAYLPIDFSQPEERLMFLLQDSQTPILITKSVYKNKFAPYQGTVILLDQDEEAIKKHAKNNLSSKTTPEHLAYIIYTSGSTGTPKGVLIEHHSVVNYCQWFADYTHYQPQQRIDFSASPIFDMAVTTTIVPLMLGLALVICEDLIKKEVRKYLHYLARSRINIIKLTPSYLKVLLQEIKNHFIALPHLQTIILGGENLSTVECQSWLALYPNHLLFNEYGPTETTVAATVYKVSKENCAYLGANVPIGIAGHNMNCTIVDATHYPLIEEEAGELCISGIGLARGYLNQPALTKQQFITQNGIRFYKTGDLCKKRADGIIEYLGRMDEQVKIRGFRIDPGEIENHLSNHAAIKEVFVVAQKDSLNEYRLVAYYILKENNIVLETDQIRYYLKKYLPDYMIPAFFVRVDSFPLTANGKLDKAALPLPLLTSKHKYVAPFTQLEKKLAKIWSAELGVQLIGIYDEFFDLGGHSLSAARIVSEINNTLERNISLHNFYEATNIAQLASIIKRSKKVSKKKLWKKSDYNKITSIPLSDFQFLLWMSDTFEPKAKKLNIVARKRLQGQVNQHALEFAFQAILKKHEALTFRILKFQPAQEAQKNASFILDTYYLETLAQEQSTKELNQSIKELINFYQWDNIPLIIARLFYLQENESELQICISHLICDDYCMGILFSELSKFYLHYNQLTLDEIETDSHFKEHIFRENDAIEMHLEEDFSFWERHLHDSSLFTFPEKYVVKDMKAAHLTYSSYLEIPKESLTHLKHFCEHNHLSINNALCAAIALALRNCCGDYKQNTPYTHINIIQSTRDNSVYDGTIGCFLRVEPVKIILNDSSNLTTLSQQIRQAIIDTSDYQQSSNIIKLCTTNSFKPNRIQNFLSKLITPIYNSLLKIPSTYRKILQRCSSRMISFKQTSSFFINVNIRGNFFAESAEECTLFGFNTMQIQNNKEDLLSIDYIFEASFFYDDNQEVHYLVISANLKPEFREIIAKEALHIINSLSCERASQKPTQVNESKEQATSL